MSDYRIKHFNSDFKVEEILPYLPEKGGSIKLYILEKEGISTFDAIDFICNKFDFNRFDVSCAGLKDEDGITKQHITFRALTDNIESIIKIKQGFIRLTYLYDTRSMLEPGAVFGNKFELIVRNVDVSFKIPDSFAFVNYYGTQRFGFPNEIKDSHIIGRYIKNEDFNGLNLYLKQYNRFDAHPYLRNKQSYENCPRSAFLKSSYSSFIWNNKLNDLVKNKSEYITEKNIDEISYTYGDLKFYEDDMEYITFYSYKVNSNGIEDFKKKDRKTFCQVQFIKSETITKSTVGDKCNIKLSFVLETGSYATVFIDQLMCQGNHINK